MPLHSPPSRSRPAPNRSRAEARPQLSALKRRLAETLVRSGLDYTDNVLILNAFLRDFRWRDGFSAEQARVQWGKFAESFSGARSVFSLYLHVPYCRKKCHFCYCSVKASPSRAMLEEYVPQLEREMAFFSPALRQLPVRIWQVGGGTPNLLSAGQLSRLFASAQKHFSMAPEGLRTIEFNPAAADAAKLEAARRAGFNRVSFGVQSLNPRVLERENREYQTLEMTEAAVVSAKELGFEVINVDLILGLEGEDARSFDAGLSRLAGLGPSSLTVTALSLTDAYLKVIGTSRELKLKFYENLLPSALSAMRRVCGKKGYFSESLSADSADWVLYSRELQPAALDLLRRNDHFITGNMSVLGLGPLAWSHAFGRSIYERGLKPFSASAPIYRMVPLTLKEEMMRYVLYALAKRSAVDFAEFERRFGCDPRAPFALELKALKALGKIALDKGGIRFFPMRGPERIFYGLFFLMDVLDPEAAAGRARLESELSRVELGGSA